MSVTSNSKVYPILENPSEEYKELEKRNFAFGSLPLPNKLVSPGIGNLASIKDLQQLRDLILELSNQHCISKDSRNNIKDIRKRMFDRDIGEKIYEVMEITPSIAASLPMWCFLNICVVPDVIFNRFGNSQDHFMNSRRNYLGTQWWRFYLYSSSSEKKEIYYNQTDKVMGDLFELTSTRGLPEHIANISLWFEKLIKGKEIGDKTQLFREALKMYNIELGFRNYFSLTEEEKFSLFEKCFFIKFAELGKK